MNLLHTVYHTIEYFSLSKMALIYNTYKLHILMVWAFFITLTTIFSIFDYMHYKYSFFPNAKFNNKIDKNNKNLTNMYQFKTFFRVLINVGIVSPIAFFCYCMTFDLNYDTGVNLFSFVKLFIVAPNIADILFYGIHYCFHKNKYLFNKFHKIHHTWFDTVALSTLDSHYIEHIFINTLPLIMTSHITNMNVTESAIWNIIAVFNAIIVHSGYKIFSQSHYNHHVYFNCDYGSGYNLVDYLFNTQYVHHN